MKRRVCPTALGLLLLIASTDAVFARGVSPYLPLNLDPVVERQIERVLMLADKPVLTRPIAAGAVLDALPAACQADPELCQEVRQYLARYMRNWSVTDASVEVAAGGGGDVAVPNRYGMTSDSAYFATARGYWQPTDHALVSLGAVAYDDEVIPEGTMLSLGWDRAQLDIGYRARWLSPLTDSSMLSSINAATMPSVTISNYVPLTRFGIHYEAFAASMSESDEILYAGARESGRPRLAGVHLSMEPASGWALGVNRLLQYGGGGRPSSLGDLTRAFFSPSRYDNVAQNSAIDQQFGNQLASITSSFLFPGRVPFSVYFEYAGEDTSDLKNYLLGNAALTAGIRFPRVWRRFDVTYEIAEWQNSWYTNAVYGDGLTNKGHVIGHWGGDQRAFINDDVGARSQTLKVGWEPKFGGVVEMRLSTLDNQKYYGFPYERAYNGTLRYSRPFGMFTAGAEVFAGRDVLGDSFSRIGAFFRYAPDGRLYSISSADTGDSRIAADQTAQLFVEGGYSSTHVKIEPDEGVLVTENTTGAHVAVGARRAVSLRSDLGVRLELDDVDGRMLMSVRALDYRYRFKGPMALSFFLGASRYNLATPAFGMYLGAGIQWRDIVPGWDMGLDFREAQKVARDRVLADEPKSAVRPDIFYTIDSVTLSISKRF